MLDEANIKDDWYKPRGGSLKRTQLLSLIFVIKDLLRSKCGRHISKKEYEDELFKATELGFPMHDSIASIDWQVMRNPVKAMTLKYLSDVKKKDHRSFENYVALSRTLWRNSLEDKTL